MAIAVANRSDEARPDDVRVRAPMSVVTIVPLLLWLGLIVVANRWGQWLFDRGHRTRILAPPLIGRFQLGPDHGFDALVALVPVAIIGAIVLVPRAARSLRWNVLLVGSALAAALWAVALALVSGWYWLQRPMELPGQYVNDVERVGPLSDFLQHFVERIDGYGTHVRGHPPGFMVVLWALDRIGLSGSGWAAALVIVGGGLAVPAVLVAMREVAGERMARDAAPFVVIAPVALYVATTADAFFAGVAAWSVALLVMASGRSGRTSDGLALLGGLLAGCAVMLSYGLVLIGVIPLVVAARRRRVRPIVVGLVGASTVLAAFAAFGFSWFAGLTATRREYLESVASERPYGYFLIANLAALAIIVGPATVVGLSRLRDRGAWLLVGGGLIAVALADLSGMSKGEVERIWLPFAIWLLPAAAAAPRRESTGWLSAQAVVAAAVQLGVRTHW